MFSGNVPKANQRVQFFAETSMRPAHNVPFHPACQDLLRTLLRWQLTPVSGVIYIRARVCWLAISLKYVGILRRTKAVLKVEPKQRIGNKRLGRSKVSLGSERQTTGCSAQSAQVSYASAHLGLVKITIKH
jgi:predicted SPOUT superfamily RNA methylase MTH1